jgi:hypothetical protein
MSPPRLHEEDVKKIAEEIVSSILHHESYCKFGKFNPEDLATAIELARTFNEALKTGKKTALDTLLKMAMGAAIPFLWGLGNDLVHALLARL